LTDVPSCATICIVTQMSKRKTDKAARACSCLPVEDALRADFFRALCDPSRIRILIRVARARHPQTVSQVAACCPTDISVVSRHLAMLRDVGILKAKRQGKQVYYSVCCPEVVATLRSMADAIESCCGPPGTKKREKRS
jgi:DNA-binding transcriptional ArsR family regulator